MSFVIPAHNEDALIGQTIGAMRQAARRQRMLGEWRRLAPRNGPRALREQEHPGLWYETHRELLPPPRPPHGLA